MIWWYGSTGSGFNGTAMLVGMLVVLAVLVLAIWALTRMSARGPVHRADPALEILRQRFARGEISQAEFEEAKRVLGAG